MSEKPDDPQFSADGGDAGGQVPKLSAHDIVKARQTIDSGEQPSGFTLETSEGKAYVRMVSRTILGELQDLGVMEASLLAERLEDLDAPGDPMGASL
jgi:hypothetical protein